MMLDRQIDYNRLSQLIKGMERQKKCCRLEIFHVFLESSPEQLTNEDRGCSLYRLLSPLTECDCDFWAT